MDVLRPRILVIDGRQYRLNTVDCFPNICNEIQTNKSENLPSYVERDDFEEEFDDLNIYMEGGRCVLKIEAPQTFYGLIIGKNRETLKNLEYQTRTRIKIPNSRESNLITIKGEQRAQVIAAKSKIDAIIMKGRSKQSMTHFVSLPMVDETVINNYFTFKDTILNEFNHCRGVDESIFIDVLKLHLTISCFTLCDSSEIKRSCKLMKQCEETVIRPLNLKSLDVLIAGLDYMNDDPSEVNVLYAKVQNPEIQNLADKIQTFFYNCDLALQPRNDHVKLHVTLINSRHRIHQKYGDEESKHKSDTFDARKILETFHSFTFGTVHLTEIHLSQRHATDQNGYYKSSFVIKL